MASNGVKKATVRRGPGRPSKRDRWGEEFVTTNSKSPLVNVDLVKLFANPHAWTCLEEEEKKEILALLPDHIRPEADPEDPNPIIPSLSQEFLRYSNNWRDGIRQYQLDLQQGRYDPEWLSHAAQAMEERAAGNFDKWKEEQFEEFWGQKQKLNYRVIAGESSKVKLVTLIEHNCVRVGDVWKYSRTFKKGSRRVLVEKEVKIIDSTESSLTFAIPPGTRVFLCGNIDEDAKHLEYPDSVANSCNSAPNPNNPVEQSLESATNPSENTDIALEAETSNRRQDTVSLSLSSANSTDGHASILSNRDDPEFDCRARKRDTVSNHGIKTQAEPDTGEPTIPDFQKMHRRDTQISDDMFLFEDGSSSLSSVPSSPVASISGLEASATMLQETPEEQKLGVLADVTNPIGGDNVAMDIDIPKNGAQREMRRTATNRQTSGDATESKGNIKDEPVTSTSSETAFATSCALDQKGSHSKNNSTLKDIILKNVTSPQALGNKILAIDGRITDPPNGNAWKEFRCYRNNQDIGSLWEIRQEWFVRQQF
ncbi:hypothetical protein VTO42DRAFT_200 [Malbranchea cinnamomea]